MEPFNSAENAEVIESIIQKSNIPENIKRRTIVKLFCLLSAKDCNDLRQIKGNHYEKLKGNLKGFYSIRINDQMRIVFSVNKKENTVNKDTISVIDYH